MYTVQAIYGAFHRVVLVVECRHGTPTPCPDPTKTLETSATAPKPAGRVSKYWECRTQRRKVWRVAGVIVYTTL